MVQITSKELKKKKTNNLNERRLLIAELALKKTPHTRMIVRVPHADDKEGNKSKIIRLYVPTRFKDTYKQKRHSFEKN